MGEDVLTGMEEDVEATLEMEATVMEVMEAEDMETVDMEMEEAEVMETGDMEMEEVVDLEVEDMAMEVMETMVVIMAHPLDQFLVEVMEADMEAIMEADMEATMVMEVESVEGRRPNLQSNSVDNCIKTKEALTLHFL